MKLRCHSLCLLAILVCASSNLSTAFAQNQENAQPPVSWVNPKLPPGPGLTHHVLASEAMGHDVGYVVWKPADFDASGATRYPVIYFLHGMGGNESADAGGFSGHVAAAIQRGDLPPVICVFPNGGRSGYRGTAEKMILGELIPLIDRSLPTRAQAAQRVVAGFSMGGAGAVRLSLIYPDVFAAAGSWGGGMWRDADEILGAAEKNATALKAAGYAVLLVNGDQDRPEAFKPLAEKFQALTIKHQVVTLAETPHNLGLYYERAGKDLTQFLGARLKSGNPR